MSELTKEQKALGAFLAAMHDCGHDGAKMREAMLGVLGLTAESAVQREQGQAVAWQERQEQEPGEFTIWYPCKAPSRRATANGEYLSLTTGGIMYQWRPLYTTPPTPPAGVPDGFDLLIHDAISEAGKAMTKFPQPNYTLVKIGEEFGEVIKAAVHFTEGRDTAEHVRDEMKQAIAMLYRLWIEGDQVNGVPAISLSLSAAPQPEDIPAIFKEQAS